MSNLKSIVCISVILALSGCGNNESAQSYIIQAEQSIAEEQIQSAIISLKNALKVDAKNLKARFLLGHLYLASGDAENAIKELERANTAKYNAEKVVPLLARAYMLTEADDDILALSLQAKSLTAEAQSKYLTYKTMAALRLNDEKLIKETLAAALSISKTSSPSMLAQAYVEFSKKNTGHASALVERILSAAPNNADALMLQGQIASVDKNYQQAIKSFKKYYALQPKSGKVQLFIADALLKAAQYVEAEEMADRILEKVPNQPFFQYVKAMARFDVKDFKGASDHARLSLSSGFNSFSLKLIAGASAFYLQNYEQCHLYLSELIPYLPPEHNARRMLAVSQLKLGLVDEVSETLGNYNALNRDDSKFLSSLSYELLEVGAIKEAKAMAKQAANSGEKNAEQSARAGILKLMMNDPTGVENLELALQLNPELVSAELALAFASIKSGNLDRANEIANKWLREYPDKAGGYNLLATIALKQENIAEGEAALDKSLEVEPNNVYALTEKVKLAYYQKNTEQARKYTEQALAVYPENTKVLRQYFEFHKNDAGLAAIKKAQQAHPENISYGLVLAESLIKLTKYKQAADLLASYEPNVKTPKRYWQLVLIANWEQKNPQETLSLLSQWRKNNPYHIEPVLLLVSYWTDKNLPDRALSVIKLADAQHSSNLTLKMVNMQVLLNNARTDEAKSLRKELAELSINQDMLAGIDGRISILESSYAAAVPKLQQYYKAKPTVQSVLYLALALEQSGQQKKAITLLEDFSSKQKDSAKVRLTLANLYLQEDQNKAINEYELLIAKQPNNVIALNNLSWLYMDKGKFSEALKHSEKAYGLADDIPNVIDTYAQALLKSGQKKEALIKAKTAYTLSKKQDVDIALNYIETLIANNKQEKAKVLIAEIIASTPVQKEKKQSLELQLL